MTKLLFKQLLRTKSAVLGLTLLMLAGLASLSIGNTFNQQQQAVIEQTAQYQTDNIVKHRKHVDGDIGLLLYYVKFGFANTTTPMAGLAIGQRDIRQAAQLINIRNLEEQKNTQELYNPFFKLLGNLDFSFVLIFLFPLIIIALCYNLISEEQEAGRWTLITIQSPDPTRIIQTKLFIKLALTLGILLLLLMCSVAYLNIPFNQSLLLFIALAVGYTLFWFAVVWWVISLGKSSSQNALLLLSTWLLLTTITPTIINRIVTNCYPVTQAYETSIDSRDGYHKKWDTDKAPTIEKFKAAYPQFSAYQHPKDKPFSWFWYYAMQHMGDVEAVNARTTMKQQLHHRNRLTQLLGYFIPSIHTQLSLHALCKTDLTNHLLYTEALEQHHESLRLFFYPKIFNAAPIDEQNWAALQQQSFIDKRTPNWLTILPILAATLLLIVFAQRNMKRFGVLKAHFKQR